VEDRERELAILAAISTRLHGEEDVQVILDATLDALLSGLGLATGWVFLEDDKEHKLRLAAHRGLSPGYSTSRGRAASASASAGRSSPRDTECRPTTPASVRACR